MYSVVLEPMKLEYCTLWYPSFMSFGINQYWLESWPLILEYMKLEYCVSSTRVHQTRVSICIGPWSGKSCPSILESIKLEYCSVCGPNFWSVKIMHFYVHFHEVLAYCCTFKIFTSIWFFSEHFFFFFDKLILVNEAWTSCKCTRVTRHCQNPWNNAQGFLHN